MRAVVDGERRLTADWRRLCWLIDSFIRRAAPFVVAVVLLVAGYYFRAPGAMIAADYREESYRALNYSDIIWLYLRDNLATHPRPYLDYQLEYPVLGGGLVYLLGYATDLARYFALTYGVLAVAALTTVVVLGRITGAGPWYLAAAPGLFLYTGLNWDLLAIASLGVSLLAYQRGRDWWGTIALLVAVWLKFFPLVFLIAIIVDRLRARRFRASSAIAGIFAAGSIALNLPIALLNFTGWRYFFELNSLRSAEPSLWTLIPELGLAQINALSLVLLGGGIVGFSVLALYRKQPVALPLGGSLLLWWLCINKVYSPQYSLWVYFAFALLAVPSGLWCAFSILDLAYYFASFQILFTANLAAPFDTNELVTWQFQHLLQPLVAVRLCLLVGSVSLIVFRDMSSSGRWAALPQRLRAWRRALHLAA